MRKVVMTLLTFALGAAFAVVFMNGRDAVEGQAQPAATAGGFSAVPNAVGTQDVTGPYEVVKGWPKDIATLAGNDKWTYGAGESVFAESPNRVYGLYRGELPNIKPPKAVRLPQVGPSISFPVAGFWRDATNASLPGTGGTDNYTKFNPANSVDVNVTIYGRIPPQQDVRVGSYTDSIVATVNF